MTLDEGITRARRLSRTKSSSATDTQIMYKFNEAQKAFVKKCHGIVKEEWLEISPKFDIATHFAINLTITGGASAITATDIAICATDAVDQTGTQVATALQTAIQAAGAASCTVSWDTTTWKFTITPAATSTEIIVTSPTDEETYADATNLLGLDGSGTSSYTGNIPEDCTVETDLPSDFLSIVRNPEWDERELYPGTFSVTSSPEHFGWPTLYEIREEKIRLYPSPNRQGRLKLWYRYLPADFATVKGYQECGLSSKTGVTSTGLATTTQYYFKVTVDDGYQEELNITTASDVTFTAVIALINTALDASTNSTSCTCSLTDGDLRFSSDTEGTSSSIALAAGTTGTDLFATLTDFSSFDTAVTTDSGDDFTIDDEWAMAVVYYVAGELAEENHELEISRWMFSRFEQKTAEYIRIRAGDNTAIFPKYIPGPIPKVDF